MNVDLETWANLGTAFFTAVTAAAAWRAASVAKTAARDASTITTTAAKANALASRINFYNEQIAERVKRLEIVRNMATGVKDKLPLWEAEAADLVKRREHLAWWLDHQTDELGVGLRHECPGSPNNSEVPRWRSDQPAKP